MNLTNTEHKRQCRGRAGGPSRLGPADMAESCEMAT